MPIDRNSTNLFLQQVSGRYERDPLIPTGNRSLGSRGDVFADRVIAAAILDRPLHHAITLDIRGDSYRLRDKPMAGLVRPSEANQ